MNKMQKALHELSEMDELAARQSPVHSLHPAAKLITTIVYILITLSFDNLEALCLDCHNKEHFERSDFTTDGDVKPKHDDILKLAGVYRK